MADHLSDEEQLEALKKWWRTNGAVLLLAVLIAVGGWFGWNYWQERQQRQAEDAAVVYMAMLDTLTQWEREATGERASTVASHAETLKTLAGDKLYGVYAAMAIARLAVADNDLDTAAAELEWALSHAGDEGLKALVRLRLAAVEYSRGNGEKALSLLEEPAPSSYRALYQELKGDILAASGNNDDASAAYRLALENLDRNQNRARAMLQLKINELAPAAESSAGAGKEKT